MEMGHPAALLALNADGSSVFSLSTPICFLLFPWRCYLGAKILTAWPSAGGLPGKLDVACFPTGYLLSLPEAGSMGNYLFGSPNSARALPLTLGLRAFARVRSLCPCSGYRCCRGLMTAPETFNLSLLLPCPLVGRPPFPFLRLLAATLANAPLIFGSLSAFDRRRPHLSFPTAPL